MSSVEEAEIGGGDRYEIGGLHFTKPMLNYLKGLAFFRRACPQERLGSVLEIGGGYGSLGEILLKSDTEVRYVNVDIPPVAAVSSYYLSQLFGKDAVMSYSTSRELLEIELGVLLATCRIAVCTPWQLPKIRGTVDLFVNYVSFQEMEPHVVENYVHQVTPLINRYALIRNSVTGKKKASVAGSLGVRRRTTLEMIIEYFDDFEVIDRDSLAFGEENRSGSFKSEVVLLRRRRAT
jgi:putative sugar O-methyltransferase